MAKKKHEVKNDVGLVTSAQAASIATLSDDVAIRAMSFVERVDASWLEGVTVEQVVVLEAGQGIRGVFLGDGAMVDVTDPLTGEYRPVGTYRFEISEGIVVRLLAAARLSSEFSPPKGAAVHPMIGKRVRVGRLGKKQTNRGRNVTEFIIGWERE